jgi:hypothetical protein
MASRTVYRDRSTGRFTTRTAWERSHGPRGENVREYYDLEPPEEGPEIDLGEDEY